MKFIFVADNVDKIEPTFIVQKKELFENKKLINHQIII